MGVLTRRQREFLEAFLRLYRRWGHPLHYEAVARALHVGRATAYEMLALFERVGLVERRYESRAGPGRPRVVFRPTAQASRALRRVWEAEAWRSTRAHLLRELRGLQDVMDPQAILQWLLSSPIEGSGSEAMARMAAGLMLVFRMLQRKEVQSFPLFRGRAIDLGTLAGLGAALVALSRPHPSQIRALMERIRWFQEQWGRLDPLDRRRLSRFAHQVLREARGTG